MNDSARVGVKMTRLDSSDLQEMIRFDTSDSRLECHESRPESRLDWSTDNEINALKKFTVLESLIS